MLYLQIEFMNMAQKAKEVTPTFQIVPSTKWINVPYAEEERGLNDGKNLILIKGRVNFCFAIFP